MNHRLTCYVLFDITRTGVIHRIKPGEDEDPHAWRYRRNTQCNFDTVLQLISLRSQPEILSDPIRIEVSFPEYEKFGFLFENAEESKIPCWKFDFEVQHPSVFDDGVSELGGLYRDCDQIPMILCGTEWAKLPALLDTSPELRNIYFEIHNDQTET